MTSRSSRRASARHGRGRLARVDRAVLDRLGVAADRGERRLQLVADREEEVPLRLLRALQLVDERVERDGERRDLGGAFDRNRLGMRAARERARRRRDPVDRPRDPARDEERGQRGEQPAGARRDEEPPDVRRQQRRGGALRPEQDEVARVRRTGAPRSSSRRRCSVSVPSRRLLVRRAACCARAGTIPDGFEQRSSSCGLKNGLRLVEAVLRHERVAHRARDQVGLVREVLQRRLLHRAPREDEPEPDRQRDADDDDDADRLEEPRAETRAAH